MKAVPPVWSKRHRATLGDADTFLDANAQIEFPIVLSSTLYSVDVVDERAELLIDARNRPPHAEFNYKEVGLSQCKL